MPLAPAHRVVAANAYRVPPPFRSFAVRSEEPAHAFDARVPYGHIHVIGTDFLDAQARAQLASDAYPRVKIDVFADVDYAATTWDHLARVAPGVANLPGHIAAALHLTGVLGNDAASYSSSVAARIDYLAARGAGFHNDVRGRWPRCLFWLLALDVSRVDFVMPHAGVLLAIAPGDLLLFDQTLAHGLCRTGDDGQVLEASFAADDASRQLFLTGELPLSDVQWAALGAPWLPVEEHARRGALDLLAAEFDDRGGAIKRPRTLLGCMQRSTCYVEGAAG